MPIVQALVGETEAPHRHNQPSRKGKKAWRKNVDVSDVEKGLQQLNEEIIKGGVVAEKESSDLFAIDTAGDATISKKFPKTKGLKADEIIAARSAVPSVSQRKRAGDKTTDGIIPAKRQRTNYVTHKELVRLRKVADGHHDSTVSVTDASYDVWGIIPDNKVVAAGEELDFLTKPQAKKAPETIRQKPISLAANGKEVPAVSKPAGGYSYNPLFADYEERFQSEGAKAVEAERKRLEAAAAEQVKLEAAARSAAEAEAAEARAELSEWEEDSAWEGFESGAEDSSKVKRPERKTPAQRNKVKRRKEAERKAKHEAATKRKEAQAKRIKEIAKMVAERERTLALTRVEMSDGESDGDENELRRKQLGKFRLPEKDLELVLPDELEESLRRLKPEGNLLKDRYRSLLVRGKVEARRRIPFHKQPKRKMTEKWHHKDFHLL